MGVGLVESGRRFPRVQSADAPGTLASPRGRLRRVGLRFDAPLSGHLPHGSLPADERDGREPAGASRVVCRDGASNPSRGTNSSTAFPWRSAGSRSEQAGQMETGELDTMRQKVIKAFAADEETDHPKTSVSQALNLMNGTLVSEAVDPQTSPRIKQTIAADPRLAGAAARRTLSHHVEPLSERCRETNDAATISRRPRRPNVRGGWATCFGCCSIRPSFGGITKRNHKSVDDGSSQVMAMSQGTELRRLGWQTPS